MISRVAVSLLIFSLSYLSAFSQNQYQLDDNQDVLNYSFHIEVFLDSDKIQGDAEVTVDLKEGGKLSLDLVNEVSGKGMTVSQISIGESNANFTHENNKLVIQSDL